MLAITRNRGPFSIKEIWFSRRPFEVRGYDLVIFKNCKKLVDLKGFEVEEFTTSVIDLTQDLEIIWKNMSRKGVRRGIRRAKSMGVKVRLSEDYEQFYPIYRSFLRKKGLDRQRFLVPSKTRFVNYARNGVLFTAELEDHVISGHLYFHDEREMRGIWAASRRLDVGKELAFMIGCANRLLIWEAIKYAKNKGIETFDLGGIYTGDDQGDPRISINKFKFLFGGELATVYHYTSYRFGPIRIARAVERLLTKPQRIERPGRLPKTPLPMPDSEVNRLVQEHGLNEKLAQQLIDSNHLRLFETIASETNIPRRFIAKILGEDLEAMERSGVSVENIGDSQIEEMFRLMDQEVTAKDSAGKILLWLSRNQEASAVQAVDSLNLRMMTRQELEDVIEKRLSENIQLIRKEHENVSFLMNEMNKIIMSEAKGKADARIVISILKSKIEERSRI